MQENAWKVEKGGEKRAVLRRCGTRWAKNSRGKECGGWRWPPPLLFLLLSPFFGQSFPDDHTQGPWQCLISSLCFLLQSSLSLGINETKCVVIFCNFIDEQVFRLEESQGLSIPNVTICIKSAKCRICVLHSIWHPVGKTNQGFRLWVHFTVVYMWPLKYVKILDDQGF